MEVTEVRVRLVEDKTERLRAFCTITLDREFVVRDIKIIDGAKGLFVAMPSRKVSDHCSKCHSKNHLRAKYCNECGAQLPGSRLPDPSEASNKLHVDVAHPINSDCRRRLQKAILAAYEEEAGKGRKSDYIPRSVNVAEPEAAPAEAPVAEEPAPAEAPVAEEPAPAEAPLAEEPAPAPDQKAPGTENHVKWDYRQAVSSMPDHTRKR